jgi:hypothetical protein
LAISISSGFVLVYLLVGLGLVDLEVVVQDLHGEQVPHGLDQDELLLVVAAQFPAG